jgi:hypothetical protein
VDYKSILIRVADCKSRPTTGLFSFFDAPAVQ